jgi:hypothetical protein
MPVLRGYQTFTAIASSLCLQEPMGRKKTSGGTVQKLVVGNKGNKTGYNRGSQISIP